MGRFVVALVLVLLAAVALAVLAPSLPAGPLRDLGQGLRDIGDFVASGFGGGYGELGGTG